MRSIIGLAMLLCCFDGSDSAKHCYPEYCQTSTNLDVTSNFSCLLTKLQHGEDCVKLTFEGSNHEPPKDSTVKFSLRAYAFELSEGRVTAFNLSVTNANFHSLVVRYQNLLDESWAACRRVRLYGNETHPAPKDLFLSCPFSNELFESIPYQLDYLVTGETYNYTKRYIFNVPSHEFIGEGVDIRNYTPFVYVDISYAPLFLLHVQPLPESYNVTEYKIWLMNQDTDSVVYTNVFSTTSKQDIWYNFTAHTGTFFFKVAAVHPNCEEYGCANSSTPSIIIKETSHRLLIMIVSTVWIPPVILYVLYHLYKLYRKEVLQRRKKPVCLLVYSPTRLMHINVMVKLANYLKNCNVAVVDITNVPNSTEEDPFRNINVVLVATSPPSKKPVVSLIYQGDDDNRLLRLVEKDQSRKEKRYYTVQLPYCKLDDLPEGMRHLKRFCLPKELSELVKVIHQMEDARCVSVSDKEFLDSVKLAKLEILEEDYSMVKETRETENLLLSENVPDDRNFVPERNVVSRSFTTNIDELNLLGESGEVEETFVRESSTNKAPNAFRIDQLNL